MRKLRLLRELWAYMKVRKRWWLLPIILLILAVGSLVVLAEGSALAPFILHDFLVHDFLALEAGWVALPVCGTVQLIEQVPRSLTCRLEREESFDDRARLGCLIGQHVSRGEVEARLDVPRFAVDPTLEVR